MYRPALVNIFGILEPRGKMYKPSSPCLFDEQLRIEYTCWEPDESSPIAKNLTSMDISGPSLIMYFCSKEFDTDGVKHFGLITATSSRGGAWPADMAVTSGSACKETWS